MTFQLVLLIDPNFKFTGNNDTSFFPQKLKDFCKPHGSVADPGRVTELSRDGQLSSMLVGRAVAAGAALRARSSLGRRVREAGLLARSGTRGRACSALVGQFTRHPVDIFRWSACCVGGARVLQKKLLLYGGTKALGSG